MWEDYKILVSVVLVVAAMFSPARSGSCDGVGSLAYAVLGNMSLTQEGAAEVDVEVAANVLVTAQHNATTLTVLNLKITTSSAQVLQNPPGIEKPVVFTPDDKPALKNLITDKDDSKISIEIKKFIINMLPQQTGNDTTYSHMKDLLNLLEEGKEKIILSDENRDLTLILGNTGCGKSTFTNWIADTDNVLVSKELPGGDFIIEDDKGMISNETINSKTTFPELVVDFYNNVAYYDMPGFSDTRSSTNDIAASFFTTSVIEHANNIKIIFLINYSSVRKGYDRNDFIMFLHHVTELLKNIDKYKNSIALVVTKVENKYVRGALVDDEAVKSGVAAFLEEVKMVLENKLTNDFKTLSSENSKFYDEAIKLINIFLTEENGFYVRLGIFRRPDDSGVLDEMDFLEVEKNDMKDMIINNVPYTDSRPEDFGRTISEKSRNDISTFTEDIEKNILLHICELSNAIEHNLQMMVTNLNENIISINISDPIDADTKLYYAYKTISDIDSNLTTIEKLVHEIKQELYLENIPELIIKQVTVLNLNIPKKVITEILNEGMYLKFLKSSSNKQFTIRLSQFAWASAFQSIIPALKSQTNTTKQKINEIDNIVEGEINKEIKLIGQNVTSKYMAIEKNMSCIDRVQEFLKSKVFLINSSMSSGQELTSNFFDYIDSENITYAHYLPNYISRKEKHLPYLKQTQFNILNYLEESQMFYLFLLHLFEELSSFDFIENASECYEKTKNIDFFILNENKKINSNTLKIFLGKCHPGDSSNNTNEIQHFKSNEARLWYLKKVLNLLFGVTHTCEANTETVTVKGFNVKMSDVINAACPVPVQNIRVFTLNTLLIDDDFIKQGTKSLSVVAPKWRVPGKRLINLDGLPGKPHEAQKAKDSIIVGDPGQDGLEGNPGGNGGIFIGFGDQFVNTKLLTITANGGDGGPGQDGGDGVDGRDGTTPKLYNPEEFLEEIGWYNDANKYSCYFFGCDYVPISGRRCTNGGDGGKGGVGGYGGTGGILEFLSTNILATDDINLVSKEGSTGESGWSGKGGKGGQAGDVAKVNWKWIRFWDMTKVSYEKDKQCYDGTTSSNDFLQRQRTLFRLAPHHPLLDTMESIEDDILTKYKKFVDENNVVVISVAKIFLDKLQNTENVYKLRLS